MCLSTVYKVDGDNREKMFSNIQNVIADSETGELTFQDIMGARYAVSGKIKNIDLIGNKIEIVEN